MSWAAYVREFHAERPGITEEVLRYSRDRYSVDPYQWLLAAAPGSGRVLDLACGSAPLGTELAATHTVVGMDSAFAELQAARRSRQETLVLGDAAAIPLATASVDLVVCSMALMILSPLLSVLTEIRRVLRPNGTLIAMVPARGPLRIKDLPLIAGLMAALGRRLGYPADRALRRISDAFGHAGLELFSDEQRRFGYRLHAQADADRFLDSLYLPGITRTRGRMGRRYLRLLARSEQELPIPLRRIVAMAR